MGANVPGHLFLVCFWVMRIPHVHTDDLVVLRSREANQHTLDFFEAICQFGLVDGLIAVALVSEESGLGHCFFAPLQASAHDVVQHGRQVACSAANHPEKHLGHSLWRRVQLRSAIPAVELWAPRPAVVLEVETAVVAECQSCLLRQLGSDHRPALQLGSDHRPKILAVLSLVWADGQGPQETQ